MTRFQLGEAYAQAGDMPGAIEQWRAARAAPYFLQRGLMLRHRQDWNGADAALHTAVAIAPDDANLQTTLGHFYWEWGKPDAARAHLRAASNTETRPYERLVLQGELAHLDARWADAENFFRAALRDQPTRAEAYRRLADALDAQGKQVDAIHMLTDGIERVPPTLGLYLRLAQLLTQQGDFAEADRWYQQAGLIDPHSDEPWLLRAQNALAWNRATDAERYLQRALQLEPHNVETQRWLADVRARRGE